LAGCSGGSSSDFPGSGDGNGAIGNGSSPGQFSGGSGGDGGVGGVTAACATSTASGELSPVDLVFMFDKSGSMDTTPSGSSMSKFEAVKGGLLTFAADPGSAGMSAQLTFFGQGSGSAFCSAGTYTSNVKVPDTSLPDTTALAGGFSGVSPNGSTPTQAATDGAIAQAQALASAHPDHKVAVVMLTDGLPQGCSDDSDINPAATDAHAAFVGTPSIPTYVIGVGDLKTNLDTLASQGGTTSAYILTDTNTAMTNTQLIDALTSIRGKTASCDFSLPSPPDGKKLDINAVNVQFTPSGGATQTLTYSKDCSSGDGWHYDNASAPTQIVLCDNTCNEVKSQATGKVDIAFGCATQGGVAR
ncbi:MAG: vWA domain-containing protein, partial [Polyangiaceae bacterium]